MTHSASQDISPPAGPAGENLAKFSAAQGADAVVKAWYSEVEFVETQDPWKCKDGKECGHFTALVWKGAKEVGCGCVAATDNSQMQICRQRAGDALDLEVPNMQKPDNQPAHVLPLKAVPAAPAAAQPAETPDPNKLNPVSLVLSVNDGPFRNTAMTFSAEAGSLSFSYEGISYTVQGFEVNPIFSDSNLLQFDNYVAFYGALAKKHPEGKYEEIVNQMETNLKNAKMEEGAVAAALEFYSKKRDESDNTFVTLTMSPAMFKEFQKNVAAVVGKDLKDESIDIRRDVRVLAEAFPFPVAARLGGEDQLSSALNISDAGKVTLLNDETGNVLNLIPAAPSYVKHCRFRYNDVNFRDSIKHKPECCFHFTNSMDQPEWICSTLGDLCRQQALAMLKKLKLTCEREALKPVENSADLPCLLELPTKPVSPVQPFYVVPRDKTSNNTGNAALTAQLNSPQGKFDAQFKLKELFYNVPDDNLQFAVFSESDFKKYGDMVEPAFLTVETMSIKEGRLTIEFKDSEKKQVRNLANARVYNHTDPDALDNTPEEVNGAIFDALNYYNYMKNRVFHSDVNKLNKFKAIMFRLLGARGIQNQGLKCNLAEFENPVNARQEVMLLCFCNPLSPTGKCNVVEFDNELFTSEFTDQVRSAYYFANLATDVRLLRNATPLNIKYWTSADPKDNSEHRVHYDDKGVKDLATNLYLFEFKAIDDSPQDPNNKCLVYFNNHEEVPAFKNWHSEVGEKRECCHRFFSESGQTQHQVCVQGVLCTAWNRMLVKKTKVYCVDAKTRPTAHDPAQAGQKFLTDAAGIYDKDYTHYNLNYNSGLVLEKMNKVVTLAVQAVELTDNRVYAADTQVELKSNTYRALQHGDFYRFKETASGAAYKADEPRVMFLELSPTHVRLFTNPSDDTDKFEMAQMQQLCQDALLCTIDEFKKTTIKNRIKLQVEAISRKLPGVLLPLCKVLYFVDASLGKRKIFFVCPATIVTTDQIEEQYKAKFKEQLDQLRYNIEDLQKHMPQTLETQPQKVTVKSPSIEQPDAVEVSFRAQGMLKADDAEPILLYDNCNCQVVVGLKDKLNCVNTQVDAEGSSEVVELCVKGNSALHAQQSALLLAKKVGVDCARFKDKDNDLESIAKVNGEMHHALLTKKASVDEIDGNRYEAFGRQPADLRLPVMILSSGQAPALSKDEETANDEDSDQAEEGDEATETQPGGATINVEKTDIAKGVFRGKAFAGELSNQQSREAVEVLMDLNDITIGENVSEKIENMVWPCREEEDPCKPADFFKTRGQEASFLAGKKTEQDKFKTDTGVTSDEHCLIVAFWQNRIFPLCFNGEGEKADFVAVVVKNQAAKMESRKINPVEINKKPFDGYKFPAKVLMNGIVTSDDLQVKKTGILKNSGAVLIDQSKIQDNCAYYQRQGKEKQPEVLSQIDFKCCMKFRYEAGGEFVHVCMNHEFRCQTQLKWFIKNSHFYCSVTQDTSAFEQQPVDPSIGDFPVVANAPAPVVAAANVQNTNLKSNPLQTGLNASVVDLFRKDDWAFHFFKQTAAQPGSLLEPAQCKKTDGVHFFSFVRGWYFDSKEGESMLSSAPQLLRVHEDEICLCPQCRDGFDSADYKDETCTCWKVHNMIFKCSQKQDVCSYAQFEAKLGNQREYFKEKMLVKMGINSDPNELKKENCLFLQFQNMFKFKEMFLCTYGEKAAEEAAKLKTLLNKSQPKVTDKSQVHFERPLLDDKAESKILLQNKTDKNVVYDGKVLLDATQLVKHPNNADVLVKQKEIKGCAVNQQNQIQPNLTDFVTVPWAACCFSFVQNAGGAEKNQFLCHRDPQACIVPSRRIMYKMRSKCKAEFGKTIREYFNYSLSDQTKGFWRSWAYVLDSTEYDDPAAIPASLAPIYMEIDKGREVSLIQNVVAFLKAEETDGDVASQVAKKINFKQLEINAGTQHALTPKEQELWHTNKRKIDADAGEVTRINAVLDTLAAMTAKLKEYYKDPENCIVVDQLLFDQNADRTFQIFCPQIANPVNMYKFKWAFTIAYNQFMINADQQMQGPADDKENLLALVKTPVMTEKDAPVQVKFMAADRKLVKVDGGTEVMDVTTNILDNIANTDDFAQMCKMKIRDLEVPEEFLSAGFKFEAYCCVMFKSKQTLPSGEIKMGQTTLCNADKPRCWQDVRRFARLLRRECLKFKLNPLGKETEGLQSEKYAAAGAAAAAAPAATFNTYDADYVKTATELKTVCAVWMLSSANTATTVKMKLHIKQVNSRWAMVFDDPANAITDAQKKEEYTIYLDNFHYACKSKKTSCTAKEYGKVMARFSSEANVTLYATTMTGFLSKLTNETFDPAIFKGTIVLQSKRHATHTSKSFLFAPANKDKLSEIEAFINEKYMAGQVGAIRDQIWLNKNAIGLTPKDQIPALYFEVVGGKASKLETVQVDVAADGIYNKLTGDNKIPFKHVQDQNMVCKIEFNKDASTPDLTTLVDGIRDKLCCVNITMDGKAAHLCAQNTERCQHYANKIVLTAVQKCNGYKDAVARITKYKEAHPVVTYDQLAYDAGKLLKDKFFSFMSLPFDTQTKFSAVTQEGWGYVMQLATATMAAEHARYWLHFTPDAVEFHFEKDVAKNHVAVKHDVKTLLPQCDVICTTDEWQTHMLGEMDDELKATNAAHVNFKHRKMQVALKRMEVYNAKITNDKLLTDATSKGHNCAVLTFQDIGTQVTYEQYVCTDDIKHMRETLRSTVKHKSLELASDATNVRKHFNEQFMDSEPVTMKINRLSRAMKFGEDGVYVEQPDKKEQMVEYSGVNRGARHEACPVWQQVVEKHLATNNATNNPLCCFKTAYSNKVTTICVDEDKQGDTCHWTKMRAAVTFKNHCMAKVEKLDAAAAAAAANAGKSGGFDPLLPTPAGGFIGDIHIGKFDDLLNVFEPSVVRRFVATPRQIQFSYDYNGKAMVKEFESNLVDVMAYAEADKHLNGDQLANFQSNAAAILQKMNLARNTIERPALEGKDCLLLRQLSKDTYNFENFFLCPNDVKNSRMLELGIKDSIQMSVVQGKDFVAMAEVMEGEKFTVAVNGQESGEAELKDGVLKWKMSGEPLVDASQVETVRGRKCATWFHQLYTGTGVDANCCFVVSVGSQERQICEVSSFCIVKAMKVLKKVHGDCLGAEGGESGFKPKFTPNRPFYKNETTKNYGWDKFLAYVEPTPAAAAAAAAAAGAAPGTPGAAAGAQAGAAGAAAQTPAEAARAEEERQAEEAMRRADDPRVDRHMEGKWRSKIWYQQIEELKNEVRPEQLVVLEIVDRLFTVKPEVISPPSEFIESTMTSLWKIDCAGSLPCLAKTFLEVQEPAKEKMLDDKVNKQLAWLKTKEFEYTLTDCVVIQFHTSLLSAQKKLKLEDGGDSVTASLICPEKKEDAEKIQKAFLHAFNNAMYMIDPTKDLPEVEEAHEFQMDVWKGGDKFEECKVKVNETGVTVEGPEKFEILYDTVLSCKVIYALRKEEIPDTDYKNKAGADFQLANAEQQGDCCIFFKTVEEVEVEGEKQNTLNNMQLCSRDQLRCMQNALLIGKETQTGCEEAVNKQLAEHAGDPAWRAQSDKTYVSPAHNDNPVGYKWVEDEGWVSLDDKGDNNQPGPLDINFCHDARRFRQGGWRRFLHGEINQLCI